MMHTSTYRIKSYLRIYITKLIKEKGVTETKIYHICLQNKHKSKQVSIDVSPFKIIY